ncbi:hypothetical protein CLU92_0947 [Janthinobacterium sp. 61]|jgi:hypothetical protein|nr:hypothetical protein CLU92_0947 [Janthinobacterium sp. 61]
MKFQGALIKEQNVTFAIVVVKPSAMQSQIAAQDAMRAFQPYFPGAPIVLASQDSRGRFQYQGRKDLVQFLANVDPSRIPWMEYTAS